MIELEAGAEVAGYRLIELIGAGGMGQVYRATQPHLERVVALKVIRPEFAAEASFRERFRREARLAASLDHPGVVPVYEAGEDDGVLFVAMRWINGPDLRRVLRTEAPLEPGRTLAMLSAMADALAAMHAVGLVHRDVKPSNMLVEGERVYLSDFGLARASAASDLSAPGGGVIGTVDYAAPELLEGGAVDARADVYGLGCVLYEMLTGSVPYPADNLLAKLHAHATADPPGPTRLRPELPAAVDTVIQRALAKDPDARYATPVELAGATREALTASSQRTSAGARSGESSDTRTRPPASRPSSLVRRRAIGAAGAAVTLIGAAIVVAVIASSGSSPRRAGDGRAATTSRGSAAPTSASGTTATASAAAQTPGRDGGRPLPAGASLEPCAVGPVGPLRNVDCRGSGGSVNEFGALGDTVHMSTMDVKVTKVRVLDALNGRTRTVHAPAGDRFILIDVTVINRTHHAQVFEPDPGAAGGRQTSLFLFGANGSSTQAGVADYSAQHGAAVPAIAHPLFQTRLAPNTSYAGELVYSYPKRYLEREPLAFLQILEFGEAFGQSWSIGAIRLHV